MMTPLRMELFGWVAVTNDGEFKSQDGRPLAQEEMKELAKDYRAFTRCSGLVPSC